MSGFEKRSGRHLALIGRASNRRPAPPSLVALLAFFLAGTWGLPHPATALPGTDVELEQCLKKGKVVEFRPVGTGVTRPYKLQLECEGLEMQAAFKTLDEERKGITRFEGAQPELNFTDSYRYELAAYSLDRYLGLGMVPVAVFRRIGRHQGAAIAWIEKGITPEELRSRGLTEAERRRISYQEGLMRLFDGLIKNVDRNQGNMLITPEDLKLHLIDHSRAFRRDTELPTKLLNEPLVLSRAVYERLRELSRMDSKELRELTRRSLSRALSQAVIERAALIVEEVDKARAANGDEAVFKTLPAHLSGDS